MNSTRIDSFENYHIMFRIGLFYFIIYRSNVSSATENREILFAARRIRESEIKKMLSGKAKLNYAGSLLGSIASMIMLTTRTWARSMRQTLPWMRSLQAACCWKLTESRWVCLIRRGECSRLFSPFQARCSFRFPIVAKQEGSNGLRGMQLIGGGPVRRRRRLVDAPHSRNKPCGESFPAARYRRYASVPGEGPLRERSRSTRRLSPGSDSRSHKACH